MKAITEPYSIEHVNAYAQGLYDPHYVTASKPPRFPMPAKIDWNGLPPPDIVRLMTGGMFHHSAARYDNQR